MGIFSAAIPVSESSRSSLNSSAMLLPAETSAAMREVAANANVELRMTEVFDLIKNRRTMSESAQRLKISENEMKALYSRFMHKGKSGLMTPNKGNLRDFVNRFNGHWVMSSRAIAGQKTPVGADMYFNLTLNPNGTRIIGELFVIETGRFDSKVCKLGPGEVDGEPFVMAALIQAEGVLSADGSIDWRFDGEVQGSYGAYRSGMRTPKMRTNYYNFGESYTAIAQVEDDPQTKDKIEIKDTDFDDIYVEGETMVLKSTGFDVIDTYHRIEPEAKTVQGLWSFQDYFNMLKASGSLSKPPATWELKKFQPTTKPQAKNN
ncbi:hypothetical protein Bpfe_031504 [Biomphalaria pfeifferi]|uniref:Uncharacterized protein n=1 Tax=Biomphalaria pfeifferi TaxID=112525 RepID=A0AAD8ANR5_BIOPF|nr:hypothetical protein Bpfe_031504 [Biomphalaria pfeifferi]